MATGLPDRSVSGGRSRLPRLGPNGEGWVGIQTLIAIFTLAIGVRTGDPSLEPWALVVRAIGVAAIVGGIAGFAWGAATLGRSFDIWLRPTPRATLVTAGPFRWIRHPICTSQAVVGLGWAALWLSVPALVGALVYSAYLYWCKLAAEEALLDQRYPEYAEYRRRVPHRMVPRPWERPG